MAAIQLIYASRPFGFDESTLMGILFNARSKIARDDITWALICRSDLYLQLLEGPDDKVDAAYARIKEDDTSSGGAGACSVSDLHAHVWCVGDAQRSGEIVDVDTRTGRRGRTGPGVAD